MPVWQHGDREIGLLMFGCPCISALKTSTIFLHCLASCCFADIGIGGPLFISAPARLGKSTPFLQRKVLESRVAVP